MNRAGLTLLVALVGTGLAAVPSAAQQWAPGGVPVCQNGCAGDIPRVVSDGKGGVFIAWRDGNVRLQRITASGLIAPGWPPDGLPIAALPVSQEFSGLAPDGLGGALVAWEDLRYFPGTAPDAFAQRVLADGSLAPGWVLNGNPASLAPADQLLPEVAPDGLGGAFLAWEDSRNSATTGGDVYAQHMTASGTAAPTWPAGGLAVCTAPGGQGARIIIAPDDSGGVVFVWSDGRNGGASVYAQRLHADGTVAAGWIPNGIPVAIGQGIRGAVRDDAGGFYVASSTPGPSLVFDGAYYVRRFTFAGALAPSWPAGGVRVCNVPGDRAGMTIDSDFMGGVLLSWYDYRPPYDFTGGEIFAARVQSDGTLASGWTMDGTLVSDPSNAMQEYTPVIMHDGLGGGYVVWQSQGGNQRPSTIQHLTASGQVAAGWPQYGLRVAQSVRQSDTRIAADGQGGAIVAWDEACCGRVGIWAQRFGPDGPTPVLLSLVSAGLKDGWIQLDWFSPDAAALSASVYRRTENSDWQSLGDVMSDGTGHLRYEDRAISAGVRYAYRLGYLEQEIEHFSAEAWIELPALRLALEGLRPNPAVGDLLASFTLPSAEPARLQLLDVTGRVWLAREVGSLGAGSHLVHLNREATVPAGMYWLRLTQSGRSLLARGVVVR